MSLGGGRFGPPLKTEHMNKEWPSKYLGYGREILKNRTILNRLDYELDLFVWLTDFKFYGAEYLEDNT